MTLVEKFKAIRKAEGLSQSAFCTELGLSLSTFKKHEAGLFAVSSATLLTVTNHPRFMKYALWLMNGGTAPEAGQVSPL